VLGDKLGDVLGDELGVCLAEDPEGLLVVGFQVCLPHFPVEDPSELLVAQLATSVVVFVDDVVNLCQYV